MVKHYLRFGLTMLTSFIAMFFLTMSMIRTETGVGDEQFLKSMIPHHSRAILVCQESDITDQQIKTLCEEIVRAQKEEIAEMERILADRYSG